MLEVEADPSLPSIEGGGDQPLRSFSCWKISVSFKLHTAPFINLGTKRALMSR